MTVVAELTFATIRHCTKRSTERLNSDVLLCVISNWMCVSSKNCATFVQLAQVIKGVQFTLAEPMNKLDQIGAFQSISVN